MPNVISFIETINSSGNVTKQEKVPIISSVVKREGKRAVDTAHVVVSGNYQSDQNYNLRYIQDIVDVTNLKGIWNFQHTGRDEAGWDIWDDEVGTPTYVRDGTTPNKFANRYVVNLDGSSDYLEYSNPTWAHTDTPNVIDLTGQFDIYIWFKRIVGESADSEHCLFSKWDNAASQNGLEIYYKVFGVTDDEIIVKTRNNGVDASDITYVNSSGNKHGSFTDWTLVRVKRGSDGNVTIAVGGTNTEEPLTEHASQAVTDSYDNTETLVFGADYTSAANYSKARIAQIRVYTDGILSDTDANKILGSRPQFFTTKLNGKVWKVEDKTNNKVLHVKGKGKLLLDTLVDSKNTSAGGIWADPAADWELTSRTDNLFESENASDIINDMIRSADTDFRVFYNSSNATEVIHKFIADGKLVTLVKMLNIIESSEVDFFTYPHKVMVLEDSADLIVGLEFIHGERGITIIDNGKDDTKLINDITVVGNNLPIKFHEAQMDITDQTVATFNLTHNPIGGLRVDDTGTLLNQIKDDPATTPSAGEYQVDVENATLTLGTALTGGDTLDIEYEYEADNVLTKKDNSASKTENGIHAKKINIPQLRSVTDVGSERGIDVFATRFISLFKDVNPRYTVRVPSLVNSVREGNGIYIANPLKSYNFTTRTLQDQTGTDIEGTPSKLSVKSIEWRYPEAVTIMKVGEFEFDYYEMFGDIITDVDSVSSTTTKYKGT